MSTEVTLNKTLAISLLFHLLLFFFLPDLRPPLPLPDKLIEVDLVKFAKKKIRKIPRRIVAPITKKVIKNRVPPRLVTEALPAVRGKVRVAAPPVIDMPRRSLSTEAPEIDAAQLDKRVYDEPAGTKMALPGEKMSYFASEKEPLKFDDLRIGSKAAPSVTDDANSASKDFPMPFIESTAPSLPALGVKDYGGTVGRRKVLATGRVPRVNRVSKAVTISIRFDVLPDGTVVNPRPDTKGGDAELEKIAIEIAKKYNFVPLPPDVEQTVQWGILPVTFKQ